MPENNLIYASPESLGIPTQGILDFLEDMKTYNIPLHSYLVLRHGKVAAEGYCAPFDAERKHRMYSISKSFTSVAIGMLITEGRLTVQDKVADIFPEYLPENPSPYILKATVRDLLMMAVFNETGCYDWDTPDWVKCFFDNDTYKQMPGTVFHYDTNATVVLCGIVEKLTGKPLLDYIRPLLDELGISKDIWCVKSPDERSWTGSGIMCTPRDLARFGLFCLNRGEWNGKQLVDRDYMMQATTKQIGNYVAHSGVRVCGYGYQFWMQPEGGFSCSGMGSQYALMYPEQDLVVITTADAQGINNAEDFIRESFIRNILHGCQAEALPENPELQQKLAEASVLHLPKIEGALTSPWVEKANGVKYVFDDNRWGFKWMKLDFSEGVCQLTYEKRGQVDSFPLYIGEFGPEFLFPEKAAGKRIDILDTNYRCMSQAAWDLENTLVGNVFAVDDYLGSIKIQFTFVEDTMTIFATRWAENFFNDWRGYLAGHAEK